MNRLIYILMVLVVGCVSQTEINRKGGERADLSVYHYGQVGGQGTGQSSLGTAVAFDGQKSFADFMQFAATYYTLSAATKQLLYREVTKRYELGQITAQQKIAADLAIGQSATSAELSIALAKIAKGL